MARRNTFEEVKEFVNNLGYELISKEYVNSHSKLIIKDKDGYFYTIPFNNLKFASNSFNAFDFRNPYTIHNIKLWCKLNSKPFELLSGKFERALIKLTWRCLKECCGDVFKATWGNIMTGYGCAVCHGKQVGLSNCLATRNPELAKEWHPTLNGDLTPYDVTNKSNKKVWWQCNKNPKHSWQIGVNMRNRGNGCPYCAGFYPTEDYNLLVVNPKLCEEWDYIKNKKKPEEYMPNSAKQVWWKCKTNSKHQWKTYIYSRNNGINCPYCSGFFPSEDNNLLVSNPEICKEWNYEKNNDIPENYTPNARKQVWWKCKEGHEWKAYIYSRKHNGCPECNKSKGEKRIEEWLNQNNIKYKFQKEFSELKGLGGGNLSYDFYLPDYNLLIEYQGEFHDGSGNHFTKKNLNYQKEHDRRKKEYAKNHNIKLLEIWHWDFENIEEILKKELSKIDMVEM